MKLAEPTDAEVNELLSHFEEDISEDYDILVKLGDEVVCSWWDGSNSDCPEDLTWGRSIRQIFAAGVKAGLKLAKQEQGEE